MPFSKKSPFSEDELKKYLANKKVVVVNSALATARTIRKLMLQLGAKADLTIAVDKYFDAKKELEASPVHILISDLILAENSGLDLIGIQEAKFPNRLEIASVMVCSDSSDATVGMVAESNIDGVLIAPFNFDGIHSVMLQALSNKVKPSLYWQTLEKAKTHFLKKEYDLAKPIFESAKKMDPLPVLAFYYLGMIDQEQNQMDQANQSLEQGLALDPKDYRCLMASFDLKMKNSEYAAAYEMATRIHALYPVSVNRILDLVKLSVYNKKFTDILDYYEIFKQIKKREAHLNRVVIASMLVCAKYFALKSDHEKNLQVLKDAAKISSETETLRSEVFRYFIESKHFKDAELYFSSFSDEFKKIKENQILYLRLTFLSEQYSNVITMGAEMIKSGIKTINVFMWMIESSRKLKRSPEKIEELINDARMYFPDDF